MRASHLLIPGRKRLTSSNWLWAPVASSTTASCSTSSRGSCTHAAVAASISQAWLTRSARSDMIATSKLVSAWMKRLTFSSTYRTSVPQASFRSWSSGSIKELLWRHSKSTCSTTWSKKKRQREGRPRMCSVWPSRWMSESYLTRIASTMQAIVTSKKTLTWQMPRNSCSLRSERSSSQMTS